MRIRDHATAAISLVIAIASATVGDALAAEEKSLIAELKIPSGTAVDFTPDSRLMLIAGERQLTVLKTDGWEPICRPLSHDGKIVAAAISSDGRFAASAYGDKAAIWQLSEPDARPLLLEHPSWITDVAISANSKLLATACRDGTARVWEIDTGKAVHALPHERPLRSVAFDSRGSHLLVSSEDVSLAEARQEPWSPDQLRSVYEPVTRGNAHFWDIAAAKQTWDLRSQEEFCAGEPVFSARGDHVIIPADSAMLIIEAATGRLLDRVPTAFGAQGTTIVAVSPSSGRVVTAGDEGPNTDDGALQVFDYSGPGRLQDEYLYAKVAGFSRHAAVAAAAIDRSGTYVGIVDNSGEGTRVLSIASGKVVLDCSTGDEDWIGKRYPEQEIAFSPDGRFFVKSAVEGAASIGRTRVWRVPKSD